MESYINPWVEKFVEVFVENGDLEEPEKQFGSSKTVRLSGAYILRHNQSGKIYIGSSGHIGYRIWKHRNTLKHGKHQILALQKLFDESRDIRFATIITNTADEAIDVEQGLLDKYWGSDRLLNKAPDARLSGKGWVRSPELLKRMGEVRKGRSLTTEHVSKIRLAQIGKKKTPEHLANIRLAASRRVFTPEILERMRLAATGKKTSPETREKMRAAAQKRSKRISVDGVKYNSVKNASDTLGITTKTIRRRLLSPNFKEWSFL